MKPVSAIWQKSGLPGIARACAGLFPCGRRGHPNVRLLGIPDRFIAHGRRQEQLTEVGLDATNLTLTMKEMILRPADAKRYL